MPDLFFELIRVAICTQESFSRIPSETEWNRLFHLAQKQSLVGICFAGLNRLGADSDEGFSQIGMSEDLFFNWMGMAAQISMKNEVVNEQCTVLQKRFSADGFRSCILKGQGVAALYGEELGIFRQSGDIDIWIEGGVKAVLNLAKSIDHKVDVTEQHVHLDLFEDIEVEAHFTPSVLKNPFVNRRLQQWFEVQVVIQFAQKNSLGLCVPTIEFNLVFLLIHIYRHLFDEGVGMRQVMDYYFVLRNVTDISEIQNATKELKRLGLMKFAGALMYVLEEVFGMEREAMLCEPNERHGKFLLNEIMLAGNMGHYDERLKGARKETRWQRFWLMNRHNLRLISYYPAETLWAPFTRIRYWAWRKWNGWI